MVNNISAFGYVISIIASNTFPAGFTITQASNDGDPVDMPSVKIGDLTLGVNGDAISWNKAIPLPMTVSVIPNGADDLNLQILANANRVSQGKAAVNDNITATIIYPDGTTHTLSNGSITDSPFGSGISTEGRLKTKQYGFMFGAFS